MNTDPLPTASAPRPDWLDSSAYPFTSRYLSLDGNTIHYIDEGAGPTILFVHGAVGWSFLYRDIIKELRSEYRCVAIDWPGLGLSEASDDWETSIPGSSRLLEAFIDALQLTDLTFFGHDGGASMALGVVGRRPELVRGLVVANAFGFPLRDDFPSIVRFLKVVWSRLFRWLVVRHNFLTRYTVRSLRGGRLSPTEREGYLGPTRDTGRRIHQHAMLARILDAHDYLVETEARIRDQAGRLPVLLTFGNTDEAYRAGFVERWQQMMPRSRTHIIDGGSHFPQEDDPAGIVAALRTWWREEVAT